ncbi:IS1595 family transposase, partial [Campylobacter troglodytis]
GNRNFMLHLKETEFRSNAKIKQQDLYKILLKMIKQNPLKLD